MEWLRSCYKSTWAVPKGNVNLLVKGRYYFNDAPFLGCESYFTSRNWTANDGEELAPLGERDGKQTWFNGSFPVRKPDALNFACSGSSDYQTPRGWYRLGAYVSVFLNPGYVVKWTPFPTIPTDVTIVHSGPYATHDEAYAVFLTIANPQCADPTTYLGWRTYSQDFVIVNPGFYVISFWNSDSPCPPIFTPCDCIYGVPRSCWHDPPAAWCGFGGEIQSGAALFSWQFTARGGELETGAAAWAQGFAWTGSGGEIEAGDALFAEDWAWTGHGGEKQSGLALIAGGVSWSGSGGEQQSGAAEITVVTTWSGSGGEQQSGAATVTIASTWSGSGGEQQSGAATVTISLSWSGSGGEKQNGLASIFAYLYCQSTDTDTSCDRTGYTNANLALHVGSGSVSHSTGSSSYVDAIQWNMAFTGTTGDYKVSLNVTTASFSGVYRFRLEILDSSCFSLANSAYTGDLTGTGVKTATFSMTWPVGGARIAIHVQHHKATFNTVVAVTCDANSFVQVPTQ